MSQLKHELIIDCIDNVPIFRVLNAEQKKYVHQFVEHKFFPAGKVIYRPGEPANALFIMSRGKVRIYRLAENGKEQLLRIIIPGEFTGELALFKEGFYEAFAEATEDVYMCTITHDNFRKLMHEYPEVSTKMLEALAQRLSRSEQQTAWISMETVKDRLLHYLARSAYLTKNKEAFVHLNTSKKDLASYLGTTPESLSREWTKLEQDGIIQQMSKNKVRLIGLDIDLNACKVYYENVI